MGERIAGLTGVWVGGEKICAIGVKLSASGVTQHGFALNYSTDLRFFQQIIPCGIADRGVTSFERVLGTVPARAELEQQLVTAFGEVFGATMVW
jgi:lipoyl(octanoyl) transferase